MDPIKNPFSPGAGSPPPELVGRGAVLEQAQILLGRVRAFRSEKSMLLTGLRGVGKTVLLNEISHQAKTNQAFQVVFVEAHEDKPLAVLLAPKLRALLYELDRAVGVGNKVRRGLAVLKGFLNGFKVTFGEVSVGLDIDPERGVADSGDLEADLPELFIAVAEAACERGKVVVLMIDEVQYLSSIELSAVIMSMHQMQQKQLPLVLFGAGLPVLPGLAGETKSYAERLFSFPNIGPLSREDADRALIEPMRKEGVDFNMDALEKVFTLTKGYPYFLQEWGYQTWNSASGSPITASLVQDVTRTAIERLDQNFFRVRFDRLTPGEKRYMRAMAELGSGPHRTGEIADLMHVKLQSIGPVRAKLIKKGMVYSPAHGEMAFTAPLFDEFMIRAMPTLPSV